MNRPSFLLRGFSRPRDLAKISLGSLEREVMDLVWEVEAISVRNLHARFGNRFAYTTLMTTLDRLHRKSLLGRRKEGRAFIYSPIVSKIEFEHGIAADVIDELLSRNAHRPAPLLSCFVDAVSERDTELLGELDRMVRSKRRELGRRK
jgi:predicted transcriptional regulator